MPALKAPACAGLLSLLLVPTGLAQTSLTVSSPAVLLSTSEARPVRVGTSKGGSVAYKVEDLPAWLTTTSTHNYTTPDTLYFQLASSVCGVCTATVKLLPEGGEAIILTVRYSPGSSSPQTQLIVSSSSVNLSNTQARQVMVSVVTGASVAYTVSPAPDWLVVTSTHHFSTPDTLYFQLASTTCGDCKATLTLLPAGARAGTPVTVAYDLNAGSSFRTVASHVTLAYPAAAGGACGAGFVSGCNVGISSMNPSVKTFGARVNHVSDTWILMNNATVSITKVPLADGLNLAVNPALVESMAQGAYSGQVEVYNPANQSDLMLIDVSLLVKPGSMTISPASGAGSSQTFTIGIPHPGGWQNLRVVNLLINSTLDGQQACYAAYELATSNLLLLDDQGKDYQSGANSQCGMRLLSAKGDGNTLTLAVNVSFRAAFAGKKNIYLAERDNAQNNSGWQALGTWEVRPPPVPPRKKKK